MGLVTDRVVFPTGNPGDRVALFLYKGTHRIAINCLATVKLELVYISFVSLDILAKTHSYIDVENCQRVAASVSFDFEEMEEIIQQIVMFLPYFRQKTVVMYQSSVSLAVFFI